MTKSSTSFITERTLECISENKVYVDESECHEHFYYLDLAKWADIVLIAPCTANSFNKITNALKTIYYQQYQMFWHLRKNIYSASYES